MKTCLSTALFAASLFAAGSALAEDMGSFEATPCPVKLPYEDDVEGETYDCGVVVVPENHEEPEGRTLELAWLRLKATTLAPAADPLVYLSGGPGSSAIHELATIPTLHLNMQTARQRRDVIFYDQRGTGHSQILACGPFNVAIGVVGELFLSEAELQRLEEKGQSEEGVALGVSICAAGYRASGVDLAQYNSVASAKDIVALTAALGYEGHYNLYGTSYGTRLALNAMRSTPDRIRAVVLDGTVSPGIAGNAQTTADVQYSFDTIFRECAADAFCSATYPDAREKFIAVLETLAGNPLVFEPPLVPNAFLRNTFLRPIEKIDARFFMQLAGLDNKAAQGGVAAAMPLIVDLVDARDTEGLRAIFGRGALPEVTTNPTPPNADEAIVADDIFLADAINILTSVARAMGAAQGLPVSDEWVRIVLTELDGRLKAGDAQGEVIKDLVELTMVPLAGTDADALVTYADKFLAPESAAQADALVGAMTRQEVRETMWSIQGVGSNLLGIPEREFMSYGMLWSVNCQEDVSLNPVEVAADFIAASPYPGLQTQTLDVYERSRRICEWFPTPFSRDEMMSHVESDIPTLVFAEGLDTQTPLPYGITVHEHLANSFLRVWPAVGHIAAGQSQDGCAGAIAAAFLDAPRVEPDFDCAEAPVYQLGFQAMTEKLMEKMAQ